MRFRRGGRAAGGGQRAGRAGAPVGAPVAALFVDAPAGRGAGARRLLAGRSVPPTPDGCATLAEAAAVVNLAPGALAGVVDDGYLPVVVVGGHRFVAVTDLVVYANRHARLHPRRTWVRSLVGLAARRAGVGPALPGPLGRADGAPGGREVPAPRCKGGGSRALVGSRSNRGAGAAVAP